MTGRRDLGFGTDVPAIIPTAPKSQEEIQLRRQAAEQAAEQAGFPSRDPMTPSARRSDPPQTAVRDRRKRTGRDKAFACRTTQTHLDRFYAIVDGQGWAVGETFEKAIDALERSMGISHPGR